MNLRSTIGLLRSLRIYFNPLLMRRSLHLYRGLLQPGDLVFDVGAHVGTRTRMMRRCGARVIAFEPQPAFARFLRRSLPRDVVLVEAALGPDETTAEMSVSRRHPTVSSLRASLPREAQAMPGFEHVRWDARAQVRMTSLDRMITEHGLPRYVKIDVEGFEPEVLSGLSHPVPMISIEYLPGLPEVSQRAADMIAALGNYEFNVVRGENAGFEWTTWRDREALRKWLREQGPDAGSGDIYARLRA
ncbi:FkbM family methyltransferase [Pararhodobacter sp. SW119]|uniref:FkbM family methyltransferase n=1 Tax=Pararhodobacter sp. SW119 TaxID=2780075 RepID=UPI001FD78694|nr:FkbM family methyltransferase [Pararhodobacter sp. SW119]